MPEPEIICMRRGRATVPVPVNLYLRKGEGHDPEPVLIMNPSVILFLCDSRVLNKEGEGRQALTPNNV